MPAGIAKRADILNDARMALFRDYLYKNENISFALIFGSCAKGSHDKKSDLDLALYFIKPPEGMALLRLVNELSERAGRETDITVLNNASAFLRHQVVKYGIPVVIKDRVAYVKFRVKIMTDYEEYKFVSGMNA